MNDYFEVDFLKVGDKQSGDAITIRYRNDGITRIHVVDGGFQYSGEEVVKHIKTYYNDPSFIDCVVATHPDGDHLGGLRTILEEFDVGQLWMLRAWEYADELIDRFTRFTSVDNLRKRLREIYPNVVALEEIAQKRGIQILEPFQGAVIGDFTVLAPTKARYLDLVVESDKSPQATKAIEERPATLTGLIGSAVRTVITLIRAAWGIETFSTEETSAENEMSVVQYVNLCDKTILLTADAGRGALEEAADLLEPLGLLPGIDRVQIPHHGSRRNVSTELLDRWFGPRLPEKPHRGAETFKAFVSAAENDPDHPRNAVIRAFQHRGAATYSTEQSTWHTIAGDAPYRGWSSGDPLPYPETQEE